MGLLDLLTPRRTNNILENPRVSLSDPRAWEELFGMEPSAAGIRVTPKSAIGYPAIWRGINLLGNGMRKLPVGLHKTTTRGELRQETKHPSYRLMHKKPNPLMTAGTFRKTILYHALLRGNGYAAIFRTGDGRPEREGLLLLDPVKTRPAIAQGQLWYDTEARGIKKRIHSDDIFHLMGLSYDGLTGLDVITILADGIGIGLAARKYASKFFANGMHAAGFLQIPPGMSEPAQKRVKEDMKKRNEGLDNAFRTALLEDGAKWIQTTVSPEQAQLLETQKWHIKDIALILGIPPHKLGDDSKVSYNSLEQENKSYLEDSLDPWLCAFEEECNDKLLTENEQESHYFEFDRRRLERSDDAAHFQTLAVRVNNGLLTPDEARAEDNLPAYADGSGKEFRRPANITINGPEPMPPPGSPPAAGHPAAGDQPPTNNAWTDQEKLAHIHQSLIEDKLQRFTAIAAAPVNKSRNRSAFLEIQRDKLEDTLVPMCEALAIITQSTQCPRAKAKNLATQWHSQQLTTDISP